MARSFLVLAMTMLFAGCATAPSAPADSTRCKNLGCIERSPETAAPVGAKLELSTCANQNSAMNTYKYVKAESGWRLVFFGSVLSKECGAQDGA